MVEQEVEIFSQLRAEIEAGGPTKRTANRAKAIYNAHNDEKIDNCMCNAIRRKILSREMLSWYEETIGRIHTD